MIEKMHRLLSTLVFMAFAVSIFYLLRVGTELGYFSVFIATLLSFTMFFTFFRIHALLFGKKNMKIDGEDEVKEGSALNSEKRNDES